MRKLKLIVSLILLLGLSNNLHAQSIDYSEILINEEIPYHTTFNKLTSLIEIDSITAIPELMDMLDSDSLIYIGNTYFELYNRSKDCYLNVIIFNDKVRSVSLGEKILSNSTTPAMVKNMFSSCDSFDPIKIYPDNRSYVTCRIPLTYNELETEDFLILFFLDERLIRVDLWESS